MGVIKNIVNRIKLFWYSMFFGMRAADTVIRSQGSTEDGMKDEEEMKPGGVFADMLEQKVTKEVEELRDKHYRVLREADKYTAQDMSLEYVTVINDKGETEEVLEFHGGVKKKRKEDFMKHPPVYEKDGFFIRTIQDNKHIEKSTMFAPSMPDGLYDYETTLTVKRGFIPRFELEKFVTKIVVRYKNGGSDRAEVDFYCPTMASQFGKIDAIFVANLYQIFESKNTRSDITDLQEIEWYSDKAWNSNDECFFKFDDVKFTEISVFDGSFVLTFDCHIVADGTDLTEKYKTKELDEKYANQAPKGNATDIFAIMRKEKKEETKNKINLEEMGDTTFKME